MDLDQPAAVSDVPFLSEGDAVKALQQAKEEFYKKYHRPIAESMDIIENNSTHYEVSNCYGSRFTLLISGHVIPKPAY